MKYPLLPYSQLVFDMMQTDPDVYTYRGVLRADKADVDVERLKQAIGTALLNHPAFRMVVDEQGMQHYDAQADPMHGQFYDVDIWEDETSVYATYRTNRILGDAISGIVLVEDIVRAYQGLPLEPDNYLTYLQQMEGLKQSARYLDDRQWLQEHFGNLQCPVYPKTDAPLCTEMTIEGMLAEDYSDLREALRRMGSERLITPTAFFSLASALAMMEYNGTDEAALTWAYDGRETKEEQRIYGSLHRDIPFAIKANGRRNEWRTDELLRQTRRAMREGVAHSSFPFTLMPPHNAVWNYALNVLVQPAADDTVALFPFEVEVQPMDDERAGAYALLDVEIYDSEALTIVYRYSAAHYKEESMRNFAALVRKYAEWLLNG